MADIKKLAEELSKLTVIEASELVKQLEAAPGGATEEVEEKTEFDVVIKETGPKKIDVIKAIRQLTSLGLVDAKNMAETAGAKVLTQVGKEAANNAKEKLEEAGAVIELA